jgi:hypothetical protein
MMRWLRGWLYSDDEIVRVAAGLMEPEAEMWREVLEQAGVRSFTKTLDAVAVSDGRATGTNVGIFVRQSDEERAREILDTVASDRDA